MLGKQCRHGRLAIFGRKDDQVSQNGGTDGVGQLIGSGKALLLSLDAGFELLSSGAEAFHARLPSNKLNSELMILQGLEEEPS